jgi:beta-aspartyl-peptidase (threonine type)
VEAAVRILEDDPHFNAGRGSSLTTEGNVEMDAGMMEGHTFNVGAVASVELIKNPISLARTVLESPHVLLVSKGAQKFALEQGFSLCKLEDLVTSYQSNKLHQWRQTSPEQRTKIAKDPEGKHGTVGAVALDHLGNLAAATSTGGIQHQNPGRVGDSPLVGCGFYADEHAAISCTGYGEDFIRLLIAKRAADFVERGSSAQTAAESAIAFLKSRASGTGGLIIADRQGQIGFAWNTHHLARGLMHEGLEEPIVGIM